MLIDRPAAVLRSFIKLVLLLGALAPGLAQTQDDQFRYGSADYATLEEAEQAMRADYGGGADLLRRYRAGDVYDQDGRRLRYAYRPDGVGARLLAAEPDAALYYRVPGSERELPDFVCDECPIADRAGNDLCALGELIDAAAVRRAAVTELIRLRPNAPLPSLTTAQLVEQFNAFGTRYACSDRDALEQAMRGVIEARWSFAQAECRYRLDPPARFDADADFLPFAGGSAGVRLRTANVQAPLLEFQPASPVCEDLRAAAPLLAYMIAEVRAVSCPPGYPVLDANGRCSRPLVLIEALNPTVPDPRAEAEQS